MGTYWDTSPPHPCERPARMEGTSNFLGLLSGQEAGPDTTEDAAALAMSRTAGGVPEALEARWAGSQRDKVALCHMAYGTLKVADKDRTWTKAAILDRFYLFSGLVPQSLYKDTVYNDPIAAAQKWASYLKNEEKCDYVICLSHLEYKYGPDENKISDRYLAENSENIDLILGGHTHTFLKEPERMKNKVGNPVLINQVGWAGIILGRIDVFFEKNKKGTCITCKNLLVGPNS